MLATSASIRRKYEGPASRYLVIDGRRYHYRIEGAGPTLVLLHGVMASLHTWDGWVEELKSSYRIIRVDLPGFGLSDHFLERVHYSPEYSIQLLDRMREAFGLEKMHLAGNSLGGFLSWFYAAHYPERVDKLILIDPIAYPQDLPGVIALVSMPGIGEIARYVAPRFLVARNVRQVYGNPALAKREVIDRYYELMMHGNNRLAMVETFRSLKLFSRDPNIASHIGKVKAPTLLMWGVKDRWVPPSLIERWQRDLPNLELKLYADAGHIPMEESPVETANDARAFLSR